MTEHPDEGLEPAAQECGSGLPEPPRSQSLVVGVLTGEGPWRRHVHRPTRDFRQRQSFWTQTPHNHISFAKPPEGVSKFTPAMGLGTDCEGIPEKEFYCTDAMASEEAVQNIVSPV